MSQLTRGGGSLSTQMGVIVHMITLGMSACGPCREKRPRLCACATRCQRDSSAGQPCARQAEGCWSPSRDESACLPPAESISGHKRSVEPLVPRQQVPHSLSSGANHTRRGEHLPKYRPYR